MNKYCVFCQKDIPNTRYILEQRDYKYWNIDNKVAKYCCPECYKSKLLYMRRLHRVVEKLSEEINKDE